ncbi:hypothetical protein [Pseudomonas sp. R1-7]|uniref:hypothetical protein n=1 Tax=Pseudomonas sp. R1-7 TaxID=2817398 RepID=UPI003DA9C546
MAPPKKPRLNAGTSSEAGPTAPDTVPERPSRPTRPWNPDATQDSATGQASGPDAAPPPTVVIASLSASTPTAGPSASASLTRYYLRHAFADRLPAPDTTTGIRTFGTRSYVNLESGETVQVARDSEQHFRAKLDSELLPSGPRLERMTGSLLWRQQGAMTRDQAPREPSVIDSWRISSAFAASDHITIDGHHYQTVENDKARQRSVIYIKDPRHPPYDFDTFEDLLFFHTGEQPRAAIQVPPDSHWTIDPRLPFEKPLVGYAIEFFPELRADTQSKFSRRQFELANDSNFADARGLTTLRQVFNNWKDKTASLHPVLTDPLLMLPTLPISAELAGSNRSLQLPLPSPTGPLARLDFDPSLFLPPSRTFPVIADDIEFMKFMTERLERNGYMVFPARSLPSFPNVVFKRAEHDFIFFMTLHRTETQDIIIPRINPRDFGLVLRNQLGHETMNAMESAHNDNKLISLRGGIQTLPSNNTPTATVFIVRDNT